MIKIQAFNHIDDVQNQVQNPHYTANGIARSLKEAVFSHLKVACEKVKSFLFQPKMGIQDLYGEN